MDASILKLIERMKAPGGRYLISVGLTREERDAIPEPTFGGKGFSRWLTDEEYDGFLSLSVANTIDESTP